MVGVIAAGITIIAKNSNGFWITVLGGILVGLVAAAAYYLLMPFVVRWAAKGVKPLVEDEEPKEPPKN